MARVECIVRSRDCHVPLGLARPVHTKQAMKMMNDKRNLRGKDEKRDQQDSY